MRTAPGRVCVLPRSASLGGSDVRTGRRLAHRSVVSVVHSVGRLRSPPVGSAPGWLLSGARPDLSNRPCAATGGSSCRSQARTERFGRWRTLQVRRSGDARPRALEVHDSDQPTTSPQPETVRVVLPVPMAPATATAAIRADVAAVAPAPIGGRPPRRAIPRWSSAAGRPDGSWGSSGSSNR